METMGSRIRKKREICCLTQQQLAEKVGVKRETVNQWENDTRQIKGADIASLADALGTDCDYLLRGIESGHLDVFKNTGLTNESIKNLKRISEIPWQNYSLSHVLNDIIGSGKFVSLLMAFLDYRWKIDELIEKKSDLVDAVEEHGETITEDIMVFAAKCAAFEPACVRYEAKAVIEQADSVKYAQFKLMESFSEIVNKYRTEVENNG